MNSLPFSSSFSVNTEPIEQKLNGIYICKGILKNTVQNRKLREITRNNEEFDLVFLPFCKYLFMFSQICKNSVYQYLVSSSLINNDFSVSFKYSAYSVLHLSVKTEGKIKFIAVTYIQRPREGFHGRSNKTFLFVSQAILLIVNKSLYIFIPTHYREELVNLLKKVLYDLLLGLCENLAMNTISR